MKERDNNARKQRRLACLGVMMGLLAAGAQAADSPATAPAANAPAASACQPVTTPPAQPIKPVGRGETGPVPAVIGPGCPRIDPKVQVQINQQKPQEAATQVKKQVAPAR
jgi:hypothetical protein